MNVSGNHHNKDVSTQRCFVAIALPGSIREGLHSFQAALRRAGVNLRWVNAEQLHITLFFLGPCTPDTIATVAGHLRAAARDVAPFDLRIEAPNVFGPPAAPRVVWVGVRDDSGTLARWHGDLKARFSGIGIPLEDRPFHPHVTIGRTKSRRGARTLTSALHTVSLPSLEVFRVRDLRLYSSALSREGARHTVLHSVPLKGEP